jgi:uncharacterized coiled-coil DUF342 family protein
LCTFTVLADYWIYRTQMDELIKQISRYQKGSSQIRTKLSKLRTAHKSVTQSIRVHEVLAVTSQKDAIKGTAQVLQFAFTHTPTYPLSQIRFQPMKN